MIRFLRVGLIAGLIFSIFIFRLPLNAAEPDNQPKYAADRILVRFKPGLQISAAQSFHFQQGASIINEFNHLNLQVVRVPEGEVRKQIEAYRNNPDVIYAEPDYILSADESPDDPGYTSQWGLTTVQASQAWDVTPGSPDIKIAILDTGIDQDHEDLAAKIVNNVNFSTAADFDDHVGHGTHVAGIASAITNNGLGVAGVGRNSSLLNVKVLDDTGNGRDSDVAAGIIWAADNGAKVINLSLGGDNPSSALEDAVDYAWGKGAVIVAAAGNNGNSSYRYPAYYTNCISVAATNQNDNWASFSNYGTWVDVAAPGVQIYSTFPNHSNSAATLNYGSLSGTSMATPFVSGLAALLWNTTYGANNSTVVSRIENSADEISGTGTYWKYGRINCLESVQTGVPTVKTTAATNISLSSAVLNGNLVDTGNETSFSVSFQWGTEAGGPYPNETTPQSVTTIGSFSAQLSGLTQTTDYYYRAKAAGSTTIYGEMQHFQTTGDQCVLTTNITGQGSISLSPVKETYLKGTKVLLTAAARPGWSFDRWSGDLESTANPVSVTMDSDKTVTATFIQDEYTLSLTVSPESYGSVTIEPQQTTYHYGDTVTLTASPEEGYLFYHWGGDLAGNDPSINISMIGNKAAKAFFAPEHCLLTINIVGKGSVTRSPEGDSYSPGQAVQLTAVPAKGYVFSSWEGVDTKSSKTAAVTMNDNRTVTAKFKVKSSSSGGGGGGGGYSGGSGSTSASMVKLNGLSVTGMLAVNSSGAVTSGSRLATLDGKVTLEVASGTVMKDAKGAALTSISIVAGNQSLTPPADNALMMSYTFGPEGAVFNPPLTLTINYGALSLPEGSIETDLYLAYVEGEKWVRLEGQANTSTHTITTKIDHFSTYTLLAAVPPPPEPASFKVAGLTITPREAFPDNPVTVRTAVMNIGGVTGDCDVILKVNGVAEDHQVVKLEKGAGREITFRIDKSEPGEYRLDINGQTGQFRVAVLMTADSANIVTPTPGTGAVAELVADGPSTVSTSPATIDSAVIKSSPTSVTSTIPAAKTGTSISEITLGIILSVIILAIILIGLIILVRRRQN